MEENDQNPIEPEAVPKDQQASAAVVPEKTIMNKKNQ